MKKLFFIACALLVGTELYTASIFSCCRWRKSKKTLTASRNSTQTSNNNHIDYDALSDRIYSSTDVRLHNVIDMSGFDSSSSDTIPVVFSKDLPTKKKESPVNASELAAALTKVRVQTQQEKPDSRSRSSFQERLNSSLCTTPSEGNRSMTETPSANSLIPLKGSRDSLSSIKNLSEKNITAAIASMKSQ